MSRIADVIDKARQERLRRSPAGRQLPAGRVLRTSEEVEIPWQLHDDGTAGADDAAPPLVAGATLAAAVATPLVPASVLTETAAPPPVVPATSAPVTPAVAATAVSEPAVLAPPAPAMSALDTMSAPAPRATATEAATAVPEPPIPAPAAPAHVVPPIFPAPVTGPAPTPLVTELAAAVPAAAPAAARGAIPAPAVAEFAPAAPAERVIAAPVPVVAPTPTGERAPLVLDEETSALASELFGAADEAGGPVRRVLVCSVDAPELSVEVAVGLGIAASRKRSASVALIDLNLDGGGSLHRRLHMDGTPGISDAVLRGLRGRRNVQRVQPSCDLWLIAAGSRPQDLRARLGQSDTRAAIRALASAFDYAVGYVPSVAGDAITLGECFDGVVLVLDAGSTPSEAVRAAADAFTDGGVPLLGTIARHRPTA